ncbi:hypothetical protein MMC26_007124 [Xylographa opegraphella]|nr:hypothetical protein [Xylographa opegraphella]
MKQPASEEQWQCLTDRLYRSPYDAKAYLNRADLYQYLGFPDLAAGDAYKALLLADEATDESGEYHDAALEALMNSKDDNNVALEVYATSLALKCYRLLTASLRACGCLKSAFNFCERGLALDVHDVWLEKQKASIIYQYESLRNSSFDPAELSDHGSVRRELYPWNTHEPDRFSTQSLSILNAELSKVAPKCSVVAVDLPLLTEDNTRAAARTTVKQLGIFANENIAPGETVLHETSILTANNRLHDPLCDACSSELPPMSSNQTLYACSECDDTVFCSENCLSVATSTYHPAVCGKDVDAIGKDTDPKEAADALYLLLLGRVLALSETQDLHPLDLKETKYIWGDFIHPNSKYVHSSTASDYTIAHHLPFSFTYNILAPLHILEKMDIDIYASLERYDFWILNTLYAKFRGTASARLSTRDGRPEVCAVHPMWCLANHSCAPNVRWEWGGEIRFWARAGDEIVRWGPEKEDRTKDTWTGGIRMGQEVLNHYCDPDLGVKARREWAVGALGGMCMCKRCLWEAEESNGGDPNKDV